MDGWGIGNEEAEAALLYREAVGAGEVFSIYNLGVSYKNGWVVAYDLTKAREYYRMAADRGCDNAKTALK
jgi:TPR repeat protein